MIESLRNNFNQEFSEEKYQSIVNYFHSFPIYQCGFRISETPIFLPKDFGHKIMQAGNEIIDQILHKDIITPKAIPQSLHVPNKSNHFHFLALDFGICKNSTGELEPQLIELQAFPSLYFYQYYLAREFDKAYKIPENFGILPHREFNGNTFKQELLDIILGEHHPHNVVLLEIHPKKQKTGIDFAITKEELGIKPVDITEVFREGKDLYYIRDGVQTPIYRIYNRVIFDELHKHKDLKLHFNLTEDVDVEWVTHPDWFFKISKYILPKLESSFVPKSYFAHEFPDKEDLNNFVLKPLFSFAGNGVIINPTQQDLDKINNLSNFILQRKVDYAAVFKDLNNNLAKAEVRLLYTWKEGTEKPKLQINLARMTKSEKVNTDHLGKDKIWTGSSIAFFEHS